MEANLNLNTRMIRDAANPNYSNQPFNPTQLNVKNDSAYSVSIPPKRVVVTGAAGQIAYNLLFSIARGNMLGLHQPIILQLLGSERSMPAIQGVIMELQDCAFPTLHAVTASVDPNIAFKAADFALLVGAKRREKGMQRSELLAANAALFVEQGKALNDHASRDVKVLVVGNPANTNALIAQRSAPDLSPSSFTSLLRLDHNRALAKLSEKTGEPVAKIKKVCVWGNHSPTMYADLRHAEIDGQAIEELINDPTWNKNVFIPSIANRGAEIIEARGGLSSAASAAHAAVDHMRDWVYGTGNNWVTMGVPSDGSYGIPKGIQFGFPVICHEGQYKIVNNLEIDAFSRHQLDITLAELENERQSIQHLMN